MSSQIQPPASMNDSTPMSSQVQSPYATDDFTMMSSQTESPSAMDDSAMDDSTMMSSPTESSAADSNTTGDDRAAAIAKVLSCDIGRYTFVQKLKLARVYETLVNEGWNPDTHCFSKFADEHNDIKRRILQLAWPLPTQDANIPLGLFRLTKLLDYHSLKVEDFAPLLSARAVNAFNDVTAADWETRVNHQLSLNSEQKKDSSRLFSILSASPCLRPTLPRAWVRCH